VCDVNLLTADFSVLCGYVVMAVTSTNLCSVCVRSNDVVTCIICLACIFDIRQACFASFSMHDALRECSMCYIDCVYPSVCHTSEVAFTLTRVPVYVPVRVIWKSEHLTVTHTSTNTHL